VHRTRVPNDQEVLNQLPVERHRLRPIPYPARDQILLPNIRDEPWEWLATKPLGTPRRVPGHRGAPPEKPPEPPDYRSRRLRPSQRYLFGHIHTPTAPEPRQVQLRLHRMWMGRSEWRGTMKKDPKKDGSVSEPDAGVQAVA
jgi:hypothetical protein